MIARIWRATASPEGAESYREHFTHSVLPALRRLDGHRGAYLLRRETTDGTELEVITFWESLQAIEAFTGPDIGRAVVEPEAQAVLTSYDETVSHHTVEAHPSSAAAPAAQPIHLTAAPTPLRIGRSPDNDVVLNDLRLSNYHAQITHGPNGFTISDRSSRNGIHVNGERVDTALLAEGDKIQLGDHLFTYQENPTRLSPE